MSNSELELIEDPPLFWVLATVGKENLDITWCKTHLKEMIKKYAKVELKSVNKKLTWKFTKNNEKDKMKSLWYILYKFNNKILQLDSNDLQNSGVNIIRNHQERSISDQTENFEEFVEKYSAKLRNGEDIKETTLREKPGFSVESLNKVHTHRLSVINE